MEEGFLENLLKMKEDGKLSEEVYNQLKDSYIKEQNIETDLPKTDLPKSNLVETVGEKKYQAAQYNRAKTEDKTQTIYEEQIVDKEQKNITGILNIGIVFILLAGLILATTTWDVMGNGLKTLSLCMVSVLFFGISIFAEKKLRIVKTSFAFWILGVMFLPVILISISFFGLLGEYFSMEGQGSQLFGMISAFFCLPFYLGSVVKYKNRFFVFLSLLCTAFIHVFFVGVLDIKAVNNIVFLMAYLLFVIAVYEVIKHRLPEYKFGLGVVKVYALSLYILQILISMINIILEEFFRYQVDGFGIALIFSLVMWIGLSIYWSIELKWSGFGVAASIAVFMVLHASSRLINVEINYYSYYLVIYAGLFLFFLFFSYINKSSNLSYFKIGIDIAVSVLMMFTLMVYIINSNELGSQHDLQISILIYSIFLIVSLITHKANSGSYQVLLGGFGAILLYFANCIALNAIYPNSVLIWNTINMWDILMFVCVIILYLVSAIYYKWFKPKAAQGYFIVANFLAALFWAAGLENNNSTKIVIWIIFIGICGVCLWAIKSQRGRTIYLYLLFIFGIHLIYDSMSLVRGMNKGIPDPQNAILILSLILFILWKLVNEADQKRIGRFLMISFTVGILSSQQILVMRPSFHFLFFLILVVCNLCFALFVKLYETMLSQITREKPMGKWRMIIPMITGFLIYADTVSKISILEIISLESIVVASVILFHFIEKWFFAKENKIVDYLFTAWYIIAGLTLFVNAQGDAQQAIIFGIICIGSIIYGYLVHHKTYLLGGGIFLVVGGVLNTLEFWSKIPWWLYLLVAGSILIVFAIRNELRK